MSFFALIVSGEDLRGQVGVFRLDVDNDYFNFFRPPDHRSDDNYTQGIHIGMWFASSPGWLRRSKPSCVARMVPEPQPTCLSTKVLIGQELFTPTNDSPVPLPGERPYSALLYTDLSAAIVNEKSLQLSTIRLGTTGNAALGEKAQDWFHNLFPQFRTPLGWQHQIANEPIVAGTLEYKRLSINTVYPSGAGLQLMPGASITAGNLLVAGSARVDFAGGYRVPHPWRVSAAETCGVRAFLLGGIQADWVGHSLILQGNTSETRGLVEKKALVAQSYGGASIGIRRMSLDFRVVSRTREYTTAPKRHLWGTLGISNQF